MKPIFQSFDDQPRLSIVDPIQRRRYPIETSSPVDPQRVDEGDFLFPVDRSVEFITQSITLPYVIPIFVRDTNGEVIHETEHFSLKTLPKQPYIIELEAPIKLYIEVESAVTIIASTNRMTLDFDSQTTVRLGARSFHDRPEVTVTTTADPTDLMAAVSTFGSALKTISCERSFPTLRGYPPLLELGDELSIPDSVTPPDTGIRIEVPPDKMSVYVVSTLAYYLGATVVPGETPRLVTEHGFRHELDHPTRGFEGEVERVLKQVFFLDCVVRTEGYLKADLYERRVVEDAIDIDVEALHSKSLPEQIASYLTIPFEDIEEHLPSWRLVAYATADAETTRLLTHTANELAVVRSAPEDETKSYPPSAASLSTDDFVRGPAATPNANQYVRVPSTDALEEVWIGDGRPIGADKLLPSGFENKLSRDPTSGEIDITIVCNDESMSAEYEADSLYGNRDELLFDVTTYHELEKDELRSVLETRSDFLHYIGHIEDGQFICRDGGLDAGTLESVGVDTFLLNGCRSYKQGIRLIDAGSVGGIVTYSDIGNESAIDIGRLIARLLNRGFSLRTALGVARNCRIVGNQYVVVGDGGSQVAQSESGTPTLYEVDTDKDEYTVTIRTHPTTERGMGTMFRPYIDDVTTYFLTGGNIATFSLSKDEFTNFIELDQVPVIYENELTWSTELKLPSSGA